MTATSLHKSAPACNIRRVVGQNRKMMIVTCILQLLGIPLGMGAFMMTMILESRSSGDYYETNPMMYMVIAVMCGSAAVFMGMFAAIHSFTEMHKKSKVDMIYALPLNGNQRFFTDLAGGACMYLLPYAVAVVLGWILMLTMGLAIDWNGVDMTYGTFIGIAAKYYAIGTFGLLALMLLYYAMSTLVTVCCGTLFESVYTNFLLNGLIPGASALILAVITDAVGLSFTDSWQFIGFTSPVGGLTYLVYVLGSIIENEPIVHHGAVYVTQTHSHEMLPMYLRWLVWIVLLTAVMIVIAWKLYTKRKAEHVGRPFVYLVPYYLMLTLITMSILCILHVDDDVIGPAILFAAIVYFVMEIIRKRGFKRFWVSILTFMATVAVSIGAYHAVVATDCFGRVNYVPAPAGISSVQIDIQSSINDGYYQDMSLEYTDRDVVAGVTALHKEIVEANKSGMLDAINQELHDQQMMALEYNYDEYGENAYSIPSFSLERLLPYYGEWYDEESGMWYTDEDEDLVGNYASEQSVTFTYYTLTGNTIRRSYQVNSDIYQGFLDLVQGTDLFAEGAGKLMHEQIMNEAGDWDKEYSERFIPNRVRLDMEYNRWDSGYMQSVNLTNAPTQLAALEAAYRNDIAAMTAEDFRTARRFGVVCNMEIFENCTQTVGLLREWGFTDFTVAQRYSFQDGPNDATGANMSAMYKEYLGIRIYTPESWRAASVKYPHSSVDGGFYFRNDDENTPVYEDLMILSNRVTLEEVSPELYALLDAAQENYVTDEDCYAVVVGYETYLLPAKDAALAEAVIAKGSGYYTELSLEAKNQNFALLYQ